MTFLGIWKWTIFVHTRNILVASGASQPYGSTYIMQYFNNRSNSRLNIKYSIQMEEVTYVDRPTFR